MKLRKMLCTLVAGALLLGLTACGGSAASSSTPKDYAQIVHNARSDEWNEAYSILSPDLENAGQYKAIDGYASDMDKDALSAQAQMIFQMLNLTDADMQNYAISMSLMNVKSYAVVVILPAEGKADTVKSGLQAYIDGQKMNMETYLPDQYEIASNAKLVTADSGEVILVCCEDADTVLSSIESALKA
ncbi:MAG: DUF4358 domain-containing protein [Faecalibacterium sp.]|jgi:hypothetical protein|nr:DUF4358 domain-containing protein [Faecalibacterium sp.]